MAVIDTLLFWLGGVVVPSLPELTRRELAGGKNTPLRPNISPVIQDLAEQVALGKLEWVVYLEQVGLLAPGFPRDWEPLPAPLPGMLELICELAPRFSLTLLSDYPRPWLNRIVQAFDLERWFDAGFLSIPDQGLHRLAPDSFYLAAHCLRRPLENCLLISARQAITNAAVQAGLSAIIFVDYRRLRRELVLRALLPEKAQVDG